MVKKLCRDKQKHGYDKRRRQSKHEIRMVRISGNAHKQSRRNRKNRKYPKPFLSSPSPVNPCAV
jgi:hypothetical protein